MTGQVPPAADGGRTAPGPRAASPPPGPTGDTAWVANKERGHPWLMRTMRTFALLAGRRVSRWLLHPITLYFVLASPAARRHSARFLERARGRPARIADVYRHVHHFAATVLDRVYLLRERFELFAVQSTGMAAVIERLERGEGAFLVGAHMGSFEALRAIGQEHGRRIAMVMYEDNARLINATLAAIAPQATLHTIALGKLGAMLALRQWLDGGGMAGLLADRTLPGPAAQSARSKTLWLPFLGAPARFSDGPFRLAAMLRRPVFFMVGLYHGGNRYELRFTPLADFGDLPRGAGAAALEAPIREALGRYVELLEALCREAPRNWFNFFDFWADDASRSLNQRPTANPPPANVHSRPRDSRPAAGPRRPVAAIARAAWTALALAVVCGAAGAAEAFGIAELTLLLSRTQSGEATFSERRQVMVNDRPLTLESSGRLSFEAPDTFVRETLKPRAERVAVAGNQLTMSQGTRSRTMALDAAPEAGLIIEAIRGTLTGNRASLERHFDATVSGSAERWALQLVPREPRLREQLASVRIAGQQGLLREVQLSMPDGDRSTMTIQPIRSTARPAADAASGGPVR